MSGEPVTVLIIDEDGKPQFLEDKWKSVFDCDDVWKKPISFLTVNGPTGLGKSLLLNILLHKHGIEANNSYQFLNPGKLFMSGKGTKGVTKGLVVWSKPILVQDGYGKRVKIFLMDTEGLMINGSPESKDVVIYALSSFLSSVQLYFFDKYLKHSELDYLEYLIKASKKLVGPSLKSNDKTLMYLIRDWEMNESYGFSGGDEYLNEFTATHPNSWATITNSYTGTNCLVMPYPGEGVVGKTFAGFTLAVPREFKEQIESLMSWIIKPGNITSKRFNGRKGTGQMLGEELKSLVERIRSTELPKPIRLVEYIERHDNYHHLIKHVAMYRTQLNQFFCGDSTFTDSEFEEKHESLKNETLTALEIDLEGHISQDIRSEFETKIEDIYGMLLTIKEEIKKRKTVELEFEKLVVIEQPITLDDKDEEKEELRIKLRDALAEIKYLERRLETLNSNR